MILPPNQSNDFLVDHVWLLKQSYERFVGRPFVDVGKSEFAPADLTLSRKQFAEHIFEAPFVVLSHDTNDDPVFNYANRAAMQLFEMDWTTITNLPSRKSAEPMNQADRDRLLAAVTSQNYIDDYSGVRISSTGRRFYIPQATVWNLVDETGTYRGQAATFAAWEFLSSQ